MKTIKAEYIDDGVFQATDQKDCNEIDYKGEYIILSIEDHDILMEKCRKYASVKQLLEEDVSGDLDYIKWQVAKMEGKK
jgi:hypothetical protein